MKKMGSLGDALQGVIVLVVSIFTLCTTPDSWN